MRHSVARFIAMTRIAPTALYQEVAERLRQRIFAHELTPGTWIDEQKLAEQYGISRTPLREALKVLASEGLVELKPRRGCYVTEISRQDLDDIFPLMAMLEGRCAADAVRRAKAGDIKDLARIHAELEAAARDGRIDAIDVPPNRTARTESRASWTPRAIEPSWRPPSTSSETPSPFPSLHVRRLAQAGQDRAPLPRARA